MCMISIIVPVYNEEKHIECCVKSVLQQTFKNWELILVDDGSTDESPEICDKFQEEYNQILVIHKENGGLSSARNCGIDNAKGKYLMFVDADDQIHPQICQIFFEIAERENADICMAKAIEDNVLGTWKYYKNYENSYKCIEKKEGRLKKIYTSDKHKYWVAWCKLYRKELFAEKRFELGKKYEDNGLIFELLYEANKIIDFEYQLYFYYKNPNGITKSNFSVGHLDIMWAYERQIDFFEKQGDDWMEREVICRYLNTCAQLYIKVKNAPFVFGEKEIKDKLCTSMSKYEKRSHLLINEIPNVYKIVFPIKYYLWVIRMKCLRRL